MDPFKTASTDLQEIVEDAWDTRPRQEQIKDNSGYPCMFVVDGKQYWVAEVNDDGKTISFVYRPGDYWAPGGGFFTDKETQRRW